MPSCRGAMISNGDGRFFRASEFCVCVCVHVCVCIRFMHIHRNALYPCIEIHKGKCACVCTYIWFCYSTPYNPRHLQKKNLNSQSKRISGSDQQFSAPIVTLQKQNCITGHHYIEILESRIFWHIL